MADLDREGIKIQVCIDAVTDKGRYNNCLYFTPEEYAELTNEEIEDLKTERIQSWLSFLESESQKEPPVPTEAELLEERRLYQERISTIDQELNK